MKTVEKTVQEKWTWLEEKRMLLASLLRTQQPPVTVAQIRAEKQVRIKKSIDCNRIDVFLQHNVNILIFLSPDHSHWTAWYYLFSTSLNLKLSRQRRKSGKTNRPMNRRIIRIKMPKVTITISPINSKRKKRRWTLSNGHHNLCVFNNILNLIYN